MSVPAARTERLTRMLLLRKEGHSYREIADIYGLSTSTVQHIVAPALRAAEKRARPHWSHPDAALLRLANEIRKEIACAEGFTRPRV